MTWMIASPLSPVVTTGKPTDESLGLMVENQLFLAPVLDPLTEKPGLFRVLQDCSVPTGPTLHRADRISESLTHWGEEWGRSGRAVLKGKQLLQEAKTFLFQHQRGSWGS